MGIKSLIGSSQPHYIETNGFVEWSMPVETKISDDFLQKLSESVASRTNGKWMMCLMKSDVAVDDNYATLAMYALANGHHHIVEWLEEECGAVRHKLIFTFNGKQLDDVVFARQKLF